MTQDLRAPLRFREAGKALRALLRDPDDTSQVFRIVEALSGRNHVHMLRRFASDEAGRRLLAERPALLELLSDHAKLEALPAGSLGRAYLAFLRAEGITAEGLLQASLEGRSGNRDVPIELQFLRDRMRDTHDLWHTVTGYKGDLVGEAALLAFLFAQTRNPGIGVIVLLALALGREPGIRSLILQGFVRGARAQWLPSVAWEELLALPLANVRETLRVGDPPNYRTVRSAEYRRTMAAA